MILSEFKNDLLHINDIIDEYLRKNSFFSEYELIDYVEKRLKSNSEINRNKIEYVIKNLLAEDKIIPGTRLQKDNILETPIRKNIYCTIRSNPGININELETELKIGSHQVIWHLEHLEIFRLIRSVKIGNQKAFFVYNLDPNYHEIFFYLRKERIKDIIKLFKKKGMHSGLVPTKISHKLKMHYNTTRKYLKILKELKLVKLLKDKSRKRYILDVKNYYNKINAIEDYFKKVRSINVQELFLYF